MKTRINIHKTSKWRTKGFFFLGVSQPKKPQELETANFLDFNFFYYILNLH